MALGGFSEGFRAQDTDPVIRDRNTFALAFMIAVALGTVFGLPWLAARG